MDSPSRAWISGSYAYTGPVKNQPKIKSFPPLWTQCGPLPSLGVTKAQQGWENRACDSVAIQALWTLQS